MWSSLSIVVVVLVATTAQVAHGLKIGFVPFPEEGHMGPCVPMWSEALRRGHQVEVYGPELTKKYVSGRFSEEQSISVVSYGHNFDSKQYNESWFESKLVNEPIMTGFGIIEEKMREYYERLVPELKSIFENMDVGARPDVLLVDHGSNMANSIGDHYDIPVVMLWPLIIQFPNQLNPAFPSIATGLSMKMSLPEKFYNYLFQRVAALTLAEKFSWTNQVRVANGIAPQQSVDELYTKYPTITPSVFGLDMAQPLCPNVFPVGFLFSPLSQSLVDTEKQALAKLNSWMDTDCDAVFYYNMGSIAVPNPRLLDVFENSILELTATNPRHCVIWKLSQRSQESLQVLNKKSQPNILLSKWFAFSPRYFLVHPKVNVFVTHCGDTSVYEAVDAGVPMIGVPIFADQPDMCARVVDAEVGVSFDKMSVTSAQLVTGILSVNGQRVAMKKKLLRLKKLGHLMGGAKKAVDVLEMSSNKWFGPSLVCGNANLPWYQKFDVDVLAATGFVLALLYVILKSLVRCCCFGRGKKKEKQD